MNMAKKIVVNCIDKDAFKRIEGLTKSPDDVEKIKQRFYLDTIESVIWKRYQVASCIFDAFAQNCFYIADLLEVGLITDDDESTLNALNIELFHKENNKKRGD